MNATDRIDENSRCRECGAPGKPFLLTWVVLCEPCAQALVDRAMQRRREARRLDRCFCDLCRCED